MDAEVLNPSSLHASQDAPPVASQVADGLMASDNALVDVLRELERERAHAAGAARSVVRALAATLQARDGYTGEHADAVHDLSMAVGARLGLEQQALAELAAVALLHDVGKIGIPDAVLHKAGPLDESESELMRQHPVIGERILSAVEGLEKVARAVRHEHERWDGGGYPDGLSGEEIPLASRIVLACDAWHALVSDRPYREALAHDVALAELRRCAGSQFDPVVVDTLLATLAEPGGLAVVSSDPGALLAASGSETLESELVALIEVASAVAGAHRLDDVLEAAADAACKAVNASSLSIERWIPSRGMLRTLINAGELAPGEERIPADEIHSVDGDYVLFSVLQGGTHFGSLDDADLPTTERDILMGLGKYCYAAVPIMFGDKPWGQIWAARKRGLPPFSARDTRFLHAISVQISGAIGRAEVFSQVSDLAVTDALTGLANRRAFDEGLELAHIEARRDGADLALAMFDLDNLKDINDHHGHEAGDAAICAAAAALTAEAEAIPGALVCRIGGDEFCVLMPRTLEADARALGLRVVKNLAAGESAVGASVGVAVLPSGQGRSADLLRAADAAQYAAKRAGRGRVFVSGLTGDDSVAHLLHDDARTNRRALRDGAGGADVGRLLTETLAQLDGPLSDSEPTDRLAAVLRRCGESVDAARWGLSFARTGARPRTVSIAGRPGSLRGVLRRSPFLRWEDVDSLRESHGLRADGGTVCVRVGDDALAADLRERMQRKEISELLVLSIAGAWGAWIIEIVADERSHSVSDVEPALRLLAPEALRSEQAGPAPLGLVSG